MAVAVSSIECLKRFLLPVYGWKYFLSLQQRFSETVDSLQSRYLFPSLGGVGALLFFCEFLTVYSPTVGVKAAVITAAVKLSYLLAILLLLYFSGVYLLQMGTARVFPPELGAVDANLFLIAASRGLLLWLFIAILSGFPYGGLFWGLAAIILLPYIYLGTKIFLGRETKVSIAFAIGFSLAFFFLAMMGHTLFAAFHL